jgi:hypothetical protein
MPRNISPWTVVMPDYSSDLNSPESKLVLGKFRAQKIDMRLTCGDSAYSYAHLF